MARALIRSAQDSIEGETMTLRLVVTFFGDGVPGGSDSSECTAVITTSMTKAAARSAIRTAITQEAQRLGYPFGANAVVVTVSELLAGV